MRTFLENFFFLFFKDGTWVELLSGTLNFKLNSQISNFQQHTLFTCVLQIHLRTVNNKYKYSKTI